MQLTLYLRWLAPATACLLLAISAVRQSDVAFHATAHNGPVQLMITSNQIAYVPETYQQQQRNTFPAVTFEWTNRNGSTSSIGSFLPGKVN